MPRLLCLSAGLALFAILLAAPRAAADEAWSPAGTSTYQGEWTLVDYGYDGEPYGTEYAVGDTRPGTIEVTCTGSGADEACSFVATVDDRHPCDAVTLTRDTDGDLRSTVDVHVDNCDDGQIDRKVIEASFDASAATAEIQDLTVPRTCSFDGSTLYSEDLIWAFEGSLATYVAPDSDQPELTPIDPGDEWSPDGRSTYAGTWTVVSYAFDGDFAPPDAYAVGDTVPATMEIDCLGSDGTCTVGGTFDGNPAVEVQAEVVRDGVLHHENRFESDYCTDQVETRNFDIEFGPAEATAVDAFVYEPRTCTGPDGTVYSTDVTWSFEGALVDYEPADPVASPSPSAGAEPTGVDAPGPASPADPNAADGGAGAERPFVESVPTTAEVSTDPAVLLQSAALAALLVFLMPFPSQLFNSTLETHEDEVRRWLRLDRLGAAAGRIGAFWSSAPGVAVFTVLAALLYGFLDPGFGFDVGSLATFLGMLAGIVLVTAAFAIPLVLAHRGEGARPGLKVVPVSLLVGIACVAVSRVTGFQPGYLYGLLIGVAFARELSEAEEGRATAIGAGLMLVVAFGSWLVLGTLPEGEAFALVVTRTALAALMVAGLEGVVFGLLPMRFLPGEPLYAWNRVLWGALLLVGAFAFFHILINPASGYLSDTSRTPLFTVLGLLAGFCLVSVAFWAWFRFREIPQAS